VPRPIGGQLHRPAANSVTAAELVTLDGDLVRADDGHEPDLFWAVRGGGIGMVTALEMRLYPVRELYAGDLFIPIQRASIAAHADSVEPTALTALTKGGLAAVTKSLAVEYASRGIRVNAVAPGITQTPLQPPESYTPEALAGKLPPLGRVGQVSDIVDGVLYLESAPYVTGETLYIDGGRTA
jgi:NAD(P)-dependent dehydrogenase (short-subunit alcohol dehydrogenase family)